jgi:thioredoxin-related protein
MKSVTFIILSFILFGCFGKKPTLETGREGKPLPSINLLLMDSTTYIKTTKETSYKPIVLFYFSPECAYCRKMTKSITNNIDELQGITIYMLSNFPFDKIKEYVKEFDLSKYKNITVGYDYELYFSQYFKAPGVPCIAI